jgi:hypothetical protein
MLHQHTLPACCFSLGMDLAAHGLAICRYDASRQMSLLVLDWVSRAAALQRRGRAGRVQPGQAYCLYTQHRYV